MAKNNKNSRSQEQRTPKIGFWHMLRDVLVASMSKGQFPYAASSLIFIVMLVKMPAEDVSKLMFELVDLADRGRIMGWFLSAITVVCWYLHAKRQRRLIAGEMERICKERSDAQALSLGNGRVKSSGGKR